MNKPTNEQLYDAFRHRGAEGSDEQKVVTLIGHALFEAAKLARDLLPDLAAKRVVSDIVDAMDTIRTT